MEPQNKIILFQEKQIRRVWHNEEWWFVIVDVVEALAESKNPAGYVKDMRRRDPELSKGWGQIATPLAVDTAGGKQKLNCANTEGILYATLRRSPCPGLLEKALWCGHLPGLWHERHLTRLWFDQQ